MITTLEFPPLNRRDAKIWKSYSRRYAMHKKKQWCVVSSLAIVMAMPLLSTADLVGHYKLDESSGTLHDTGTGKAVDVTNSLKDSKDYAQPSVPAGTYGDLTLTADQAKQFKSSIHVPAGDGLNLGLAANSKLNLTGNFTVMAWVKVSKTDGYHIIFATGAGSGNGWKIGVSEDNFVFTANGVADVSLDSVTVEADKWYHVAVTVAGTIDARTITFYVNGKKANTDALTADDIKPSDAKDMHIGTAENGDDTPENLDGNVEDLRIYNTVLNEKEIQTAAVTAAP
jgi:hypothetical protein